MIKIENNEAYTDMPETKKIHRKSSDVYGTRCTLFEGETEKDFEEVKLEDIPVEPNPDENLMLPE